MCFEWSCKCVPIIQINTGTPLGATISQCGSSGIPVYLWVQWSSSVFQLCKLTLDHHWVLASVSVVPVASQCTCGSSGPPVRSVQWYPSVLTESGLEIIRSGHFPACDPLCIQLVWWELFELNWFQFNCNPKYTKNYNGAHTKGMHMVMLKYSQVLRAELVSI